MNALSAAFSEVFPEAHGLAVHVYPPNYGVSKYKYPPIVEEAVGSVTGTSVIAPPTFVLSQEIPKEA